MNLKALQPIASIVTQNRTNGFGGSGGDGDGGKNKVARKHIRANMSSPANRQTNKMKAECEREIEETDRMTK